MTCAELKTYIQQHPDMSDREIGKRCGYHKEAVKWHRQQLGILRKKAQPIDETGNRYGKLIVLHKDNSNVRNDGAYWVCRCDCGNITIVKATNLRNRNHPTRSCGCDKVDFANARKGKYELWDNGTWKRIDEFHIQHGGCKHIIPKGKKTRSYMCACPICVEQERQASKTSKERRCLDCGCAIERPKKLCPACKAKHEAEKRAKKIRKRGTLSERTRYAHAKKNGKIDWSISLEKLRIRDRDVCALCGKSVDMKAYHMTDNGAFVAHGMYPSIDHIIPLSKGGTHTWDNVQLAHCLCNSMKCDAIEGEGA